MSVIRECSVKTRADIVKALIPLHMDDDRGEDLFITYVENGYRFATWGGQRSVEVIGHSVNLDCIRVTWKQLDSDGARAWDEDTTNHSMMAANDVAKAIVEFVCHNQWPSCATRHRKSFPRVTEFFDDKPYSTVDVVIQISSSLESLELYRTFKEQELSYKQDMGGYLHTIGHINDRPVAITPMIHIIGGVNVLYVEPQSALVDWEMIENWVNRVVPEGTPMCNSPINALGYIRDAIRKKEGVANA